MPFDGSTWDNTSPTNSDLVNEGDDNLRDIKQGVQGRMDREHVWPSSQSSTNQGGIHRYITFQAQTSTPALVSASNTQVGCLFVNTNNSLMYENSAGSVVTVIGGATDTSGLIPAGVFMPYGGTNTPDGWIACTGGAVSRTTYARLFNAIGTIWGTGDGSTTFNVPDMAGFVPVGQSAGGLFVTLASSTGEVSHTLSASEIPSLSGSFQARDSNSGGTSDPQLSNGSGTLQSVNVSVNTSGGGAAHNNVQPSKVVRYIIKD